MNIDELRAEVERVKEATVRICARLDELAAQSNSILDKLEHTKVLTTVQPIKPEGK